MTLVNPFARLMLFPHIAAYRLSGHTAAASSVGWPVPSAWHGTKPEGVDGSRVEEMVLAGQIEEVARYCESDVLNTYRVWLVYELFPGSITAKEHDWSEAQVRDFVASRQSANPHLSKAVGVPEATTQNSSAVVSN
jgi:hypothetical protein